MKSWVKLWTDILRDPKMGELPLETWGLWCKLLALAGGLDHRDNEGNETGQLDSAEHVCWHLRLDTQDFERVPAPLAPAKQPG